MVSVNLERLPRDEIARHVGSVVRLREPAGVGLTLADVSPPQISGPWESFSVVLRGAPGTQLEQRSYQLEHDALGAFELFLVPIAPDDLGPRYEAVFNRATSMAAHTGGE